MSAERPVERTPGEAGAWASDGDRSDEGADAPVTPGAAEAAAAYAAAASATHAPSGSATPAPEADPPEADSDLAQDDPEMLSYMDAAVEAEVPETVSAAGSPDGDHERQVVLDLEELAAKAQRADEYLVLAQRTRADFDNYRKRATREAAAAQERGIAKLAKELLPAIDNLDRAVQAVLAPAPASEQADSPEDSQLASGIRLVYAELLAALARVGIEPFSPVGEPFDPQYHEAVAQTPVEGATSGSVVEVYQPGYRLGETVLRPARVLVAA